MSEQISKEKVEEILKQRADKIATPQVTEDSRNVIVTVAIVGVGEERIGIPINGLAGISRIPNVARLPRMPETLLGIVQIRGEMIGVVDIGQWFGIKKSSRGGLLAVVEGEPGKIGLLVDSVLGFRDLVAEDFVESFCNDAGSTGHPIQGTTKDLVAVLNLEQLFVCSEVVADFSGEEHMADHSK